ncbi:MAG: hypothetical protein KDI44_02485 [Thiothrix sp.]|nr:hypothetical protein [Thiothrix sp.]
MGNAQAEQLRLQALDEHGQPVFRPCRFIISDENGRVAASGSGAHTVEVTVAPSRRYIAHTECRTEGRPTLRGAQDFGIFTNMHLTVTVRHFGY